MSNQNIPEEISADEMSKVMAQANENVAGLEVDKQVPKKRFPQDYIDYDKEGAFKVITSFADHIREGYNLGANIKTERPFSHVVIAGMGGSGIAGELVKTLCQYHEDCSVSIETTRGYEAPKSVNENTLLIAVSYSGNTEETISTYKTALRKKCQSITISSGGKLQELAKLNNHPHIKLPINYQPRMAMGLLLFPILRVLENAGVIRRLDEEVKSIVDTLKRAGLSGKAVELSEKCFEKIPLIYADSTFYPVAYRWRTQINENAKATAFSAEFSEFNHNELLSFTNRNASFHAFFLSTDKQHRRISKRIELTKAILQTKGVPVTEIASKGSMLKQMMTAMYLDILMSYFLALRYEIDPTPVKLIEQFKEDLGPFFDLEVLCMALRALSKSEAKLLDATADVAGFKRNVLMERAGTEFAKFLENEISQKETILFVCGLGDNGGDGFVAARQLVHKGYTVSALSLGKSDKSEALTNSKILEHMSVPIHSLEECASFDSFDIIVDCMLGYGQKGAPKEEFAKAINLINASGKKVLACDIPSGVDVDTGTLFEPHIVAYATCALATPKKGFIHAKDACGKISVAGIGIPSFVYEQIGLPDGEYLVEGICSWPEEELEYDTN